MEVVRVDGGAVEYRLPVAKVEHLSFSKKGTFLVTWSRMFKGDKGPNLKIWKLEPSKTRNPDDTIAPIAAYTDRKQPTQETWPTVKFSDDERLGLRIVTNALHIYEGADFKSEPTDKIRVEGVTQFSIGPGESAPYRIAAVTPEKKTQPARVRIYNGSEGPVAAKSFFKAQDIVLRWSPNSRSLLIETHTDVDSTKSSYYGETNLYLLRTDGSFDCTVQRTAEGPLHDVAWSPLEGSLPLLLDACLRM